MFTDVGWGEILVVVVVGIILIGPERLPRVIQDVRAAIYAARNAIENAKKELAGELGPEFDQFREPLNDLAALRRMTPKAAITKTLLDGDDSFFKALDSTDPRKLGVEQDMKQALGNKPRLGSAQAGTKQEQQSPQRGMSATPAPQQGSEPAAQVGDYGIASQPAAGWDDQDAT